MNISPKKAIVTGHSSGLGSALAAQLLLDGQQVLGIARRENPVLKQKYPQQLQEVALDLSDMQALAAFLNSSIFTAYCQDAALLLINCAGTQQPANILGKQGSAAIAHAIALNVAAPLMLADACAQYASRLDIVHISSGAAHKAYAGWSIYGASKAALDHHARHVSIENQDRIRIASIAPGVIETAMQAEIRNNHDFPARERFLLLKSQGQLQDVSATARALLAYCASEAFGREAVADIRHLIR